MNWYAHENVRFGLNYTDGEDNLSNDDGNELRVRFQLTF
ncbi:MAG: phosphate-selective porin [Paracoccaceae bacterium]